MRTHWTLAQARGSALIVALIALAVLLGVVAGALAFTAQNREASVMSMRGDKSTACAEAARKHLLSKLKLFNVNVDTLTLDTPIPDDAVPSRQSRAITGHYDTISSVNAAVDATGVVPAASVSSTRKQVRDVANSNPARPTLGGTPYRVAVTCREPGGREQEVEFVFRYGL